jgi:hypothetical protein
LRVARAGNRTTTLLLKAGRAKSPLERLIVYFDFFRSAVKANPELVNEATFARLEHFLEAEGTALLEAAARQANKDGNTKRRRTA